MMVECGGEEIEAVEGAESPARPQMTIQTRQKQLPVGAKCPPAKTPNPPKRPRQTSFSSRKKRKLNPSLIQGINSNNNSVVNTKRPKSMTEVIKSVMFETTNVRGVKTISLLPPPSILVSNNSKDVTEKSKLDPKREKSQNSNHNSKKVKLKVNSNNGANKDEPNLNVGFRKSRRLLFKHNRREILKNKNSNCQQDSVQPFGRVVELINTNDELDRDDQLTKFLFMGNLDLIPRSCSTKEQEVPSLRKLCIQAVIKQKRDESESKETKYFEEKLVGLSDSSSLGSFSSASSSCSPEEYPQLETFFSFETHVKSLLAHNNNSTADKNDNNNNNNLPSIEDCIAKIHRCGSKIQTINSLNASKDAQVQNNGKSSATGNNGKVENPETNSNWLNWGDYMTKLLQQSSSDKAVPNDIESGTFKMPTRSRGKRQQSFNNKKL